MEQTASRLVRNAGSWYEHGYVYDGYSNFGEVIGSAIGPGSNSHYFSLSKIGPDENYGLAFEIVDQDNDFFHEAFSSAGDYRRYWKDYNFQLFLINPSTGFFINSFSLQQKLKLSMGTRRFHFALLSSWKGC